MGLGPAPTRAAREGNPWKALARAAAQRQHGRLERGCRARSPRRRCHVNGAEGTLAALAGGDRTIIWPPPRIGTLWRWPWHPARRARLMRRQTDPDAGAGRATNGAPTGSLEIRCGPGARRPCAKQAALARPGYRLGRELRIDARARSGLDDSLRPGAEHSLIGGVLDAHLVERDGEQAHRALTRPGGLGAAQAAAIRKAGDPADEPDTEPLRPGRCVRRQALDQVIGPPGPRRIGAPCLGAPLRKGQRLLRREQGRRCTLACSRSGRNGRTGLGARPGPLDPEALEPGLPGRFPRPGVDARIPFAARPVPALIRSKPPVGQRPAGGRDMNAQGLLRGVIAPAHGRGAVGSGRPGTAEREGELEPLALQAGRQRLPRCGGIGRLGGEREEVRAAQNMRRFRLGRRRRRGLERGRRRAVWPRRRTAPEQESPARQRERGHEAAGNGKTAGPEIGLAHVRVIPNCKAGSTPPGLFLLTGR
ncbi:LigA protein [Sphingomonas sp. LH128]|nr:LigA protein [Sphingomonas sp. LH128]